MLPRQDQLNPKRQEKPIRSACGMDATDESSVLEDVFGDCFECPIGIA